MTAHVIAALTTARVHGIVPRYVLAMLAGLLVFACGFAAMIVLAAAVHSPWTVALGAFLLWCSGIGYGYAIGRHA